jgi:putative transposase
MTIFKNRGDYEAFEQVLAEAVERFHSRLLAYCLMPNHWHLMLWPQEDGELSRFVGWPDPHAALARPPRHRHLYQGRFKSFPIQQDEHYYTVAPRRPGMACPAVLLSFDALRCTLDSFHPSPMAAGQP